MHGTNNEHDDDVVSLHQIHVCVPRIDFCCDSVLSEPSLNVVVLISVGTVYVLNSSQVWKRIYLPSCLESFSILLLYLCRDVSARVW